MTRFQVANSLDGRVAREVLAPRVRHVRDAVEREAQRLAPPVKTWHTARDERVRPAHRDADRQAIPDNLRYVLNKADGQGGVDLARAPRDPDLPFENRVNCFPGETRVLAAGVTASWRSAYKGPLARLTTASGRVLTGTPNHPVLTNRGWVPLGALHVGEQLVTTGIGPLRQASPAEPEIEDLPATLSEVHAALAEEGLTSRMSRVTVNFYGDRPAGDVEVVRPHRLLAEHDETGLGQNLRDLVLALTDGAAPTRGLGRQLLGAGAGPAPRRVGRSGKTPPVLRGSAAHPSAHGLTAASGRHPRGEQGLSQWPSADTERAGERLLALPGAVSLDRVTDLRVSEDHGLRHVYTLSTVSGIYAAAGIVVANCRCSSERDPDPLRDSIRGTDVHVVGTRVSTRVETRYPRAVESEIGTDEDTPARFMRGACQRASTT